MLMIQHWFFSFLSPFLRVGVWFIICQYLIHQLRHVGDVNLAVAVHIVLINLRESDNPVDVGIEAGGLGCCQTHVIIRLRFIIIKVRTYVLAIAQQREV